MNTMKKIAGMMLLALVSVAGVNAVTNHVRNNDTKSHEREKLEIIAEANSIVYSTATHPERAKELNSGHPGMTGTADRNFGAIAQIQAHAHNARSEAQRSNPNMGFARNELALARQKLEDHR